MTTKWWMSWTLESVNWFTHMHGLPREQREQPTVPVCRVTGEDRDCSSYQKECIFAKLAEDVAA